MRGFRGWSGRNQALLSMAGRVLLVVLIVLAIISPTLFKDSRRGCLNHEDHLMLAAILYANDYDDTFSPADWTDSIGTYLESTGEAEEPAQYYVDPASRTSLTATQ